MLYQVDATDRRIIEFLQEDGKMKIKDIALRLKLTNTPVFDRIKRLEREGYIKGYTAKVNQQKLGYHITAFCSITLEKHTEENIEQFVREVQQLPEVKECYHIAGMFDYLLKVIVTDMTDYQKFITHKLTSLSNLGKVQSSFVMTIVK